MYTTTVGTIKELYEWACEHNAENADLVARDSFGSQTSYIEADLIKHSFNGSIYFEIELN